MWLLEFTPSPLPREVPARVKPILSYLYANYREKITLDDLTHQFHLNKTTLNEQFKQATGYSLIAYVNRIRMQMAESMLRNTTLPASEIMIRIGLQDDAQFLRQFRKYSGNSPAEYRRKFCRMLHRS